VELDNGLGCCEGSDPRYGGAIPFPRVAIGVLASGASARAQTTIASADQPATATSSGVPGSTVNSDDGVGARRPSAGYATGAYSGESTPTTSASPDPPPAAAPKPPPAPPVPGPVSVP